jgi:1-acyl-sn-glycerol-3-phosphate acyltransferase
MGLFEFLDMRIKKSVDYLNLFLVRCTNIVGTTYKFINVDSIPKIPIIFVSNPSKYV